MMKAAQSAAKWLADKAKADPKLNPIPYPFFKSIVNKQVEWARTQRGIRLEFEELAEAVRTELLKVGIHTMADASASFSRTEEAKPECENVTEFVCRTCETGNIDKKNCPLYNCFVQQKSGRNMHIFLCVHSIMKRKNVKCPQRTIH